jgi:hypothetical protein
VRLADEAGGAFSLELGFAAPGFNGGPFQPLNGAAGSDAKAGL